MHRRLRAAAALGLMLVLASACGGSQASIESAPAPVLTLAVIGDTPYGDEQLAAFPHLVEAINRQSSVDVVLHLGDIKTGGSPCDVGYYRQIRMLMNAFAFPLLYTPGDNEWTDCHRAAAGGHVPTERLARLRGVFFAQPGMSLGGDRVRVRTQARGPDRRPFPENVLWTGRAGTRRGSYARIVTRLTRRARAYGRPVLLLNGDTHRFLADRPIAAPNVRRITVEGETAGEWLRVQIDPRSESAFAYRRRTVSPSRGVMAN